MAEQEGVRLDTFVPCSDGARRDVFDPEVTAQDFMQWLTDFLKVNNELPSKALENAIDLITDMHRAVIAFNTAYESDDGVDDDDLIGDDEDK